MKELMIHVERAVRPVRARPGRKMKMRRELLAHLTEVYEQEKAALRDDQLALHQATRRFGDPAALTRELQATVPLWERLLFAAPSRSRWVRQLDDLGDRRWGPNLIFRAPGESAARHAVRLAALYAGWTACALLIISLAVAGIRSEPVLGTAPLLGLVAYAFVSILLAYGFCDALAGGFRVGPLARAAGWLAAAFVTSAGMIAGFQVIQPDNPLWEYLAMDPVRLAVAAVVNQVWPVATVLLIQAAAIRGEASREWLALDLGG